MGKTSKLQFARRESYSTINFYTLHNDVWGPSAIIYIDGYWFYLIIMNECLCYTWHFVMYRKSEVVDLFIAFINYVN